MLRNNLHMCFVHVDKSESVGVGEEEERYAKSFS